MTNAPDGGRVPHFEMRHRLALALEHADLSVNDIAEELGVHRNTIGRYLSGKHLPRAVLIAWALRTGVPLRWLEAGEMDHDGDDGGASITGRTIARYRHGNRDNTVLELIAA